jgi:hypothetical protein
MLININGLRDETFQTLKLKKNELEFELNTQTENSPKMSFSTQISNSIFSKLMSFEYWV